MYVRNKHVISVSHNRNDITPGETEKIKVKNSCFEAQIILTFKSTWERWIIIENCQAWIEILISKIYLWVSLYFSDLETEKGKIIAVLWNPPPVDSTKVHFTNLNFPTKR